MQPLKLTDEQLTAIMSAAAPLHPPDRSPFLEAIAERLRGCEPLGDGAVHRVICEVQRLYFDPPHLGTYGKYR